MKSIAIIIGTRPEAIKCAPVIRALKAHPNYNPIVVSTGQHRQMLDETFTVFGIEPDLDLDVMASSQTLSQVTYRVIRGLSDHIEPLAPDAIMVHGDTATTLAGALAGFQHQIPIIHVEAGLRSGKVDSPFPEEANRRLVGQIATLHLAPTVGNSANLIREGVNEEQIAITGNTVIDALQWAVENIEDFGDPRLEDLADESRRVILASAHHRESWDMLPDIAEALSTIAAYDDVRIVVPLHRNPAVREAMLPKLDGHPSITLVDPLPYLNFCKVMQCSDIIVSDSSGAEEEGPALGKPTLVLRDITERPEAVKAGTARLIGRSCDRIIDEVTSLLRDDQAYERMATAVNPYGDGRATERILGALETYFYGAPLVQPFVAGCQLATASAPA